MEENMRSRKEKTKIIFAIMIIFTLILIVFFALKNNKVNLISKQTNNITKAVTAKETKYLTSTTQAEKEFVYLSDIQYDKTQSSVGWGNITLDGNLETQYNNGLITLLIDGQKKHFVKGISAHATSTLVYDISDYDYDYFTTYIGVDESRGTNGNGVKFIIYTSVDGENWEPRTETTNVPVLKGNTNALFKQIDIRDANYIKLYCHNNGNATADHAVYANAKLIKDGYVEKDETVAFIKTLEQYDAILANKTIEQQVNENELTLLQRTFVKNVGYDILQAIAQTNEENKEAIRWLMSDAENLNYYILGGTPSGSYGNSLKELAKLLKAYKSDFDNQEPINNGKDTKGKLYKRMAITLSLTHSSRVGLWMQSSEHNQSDSVKRYELYKKMYDEGKFKVTEARKK